MLLSIVTVIHVVVCVLLILVVLVQQGRGADMGAAFGGGSNTLFGAGGATDFLTRFTTVTAVLFMVTSLALATYASAGRSGEPAPGRLFRDRSQQQPAETGAASSPQAEPAPAAPAAPQPAAPAPQTAQ